MSQTAITPLAQRLAEIDAKRRAEAEREYCQVIHKFAPHCDELTDDEVRQVQTVATAIGLTADQAYKHFNVSSRVEELKAELADARRVDFAALEAAIAVEQKKLSAVITKWADKTFKLPPAQANEAFDRVRRAVEKGLGAENEERYRTWIRCAGPMQPQPVYEQWGAPDEEESAGLRDAERALRQARAAIENLDNRIASLQDGNPLLYPAPAEEGQQQ